MKLLIITQTGETRNMDSVLYAFLWFAITLIVIVTMSIVGGWTLLPTALIAVLAFIAGKMHEGW